jgi:hypothetical protein
LPNIHNKPSHPSFQLQINLGSGAINDGDTESHHSNQKKIGRATFFSPTAGGGPNHTFRSTISSPDNAGRVTQHLMQVQTRMTKEAARVERLKTVK